MKKTPEWLKRDFILGYFGVKTTTAQKKYRDFVNALYEEKYDSPLNEVQGSTLLGSPDFIAFIKEKYLSGKKPDLSLPAINELLDKPDMNDIFYEVDRLFREQSVLSRNIKLFLCHRYTGEKLKNIGVHFGIGESGVSQASRRVADKIKKDKKLRAKVAKIKRKLKLSRV